MADPQIESVLQEARVFPPPAALAETAQLGSLEAYQSLWDEVNADPDAFWGRQAREQLHWFKPFETVLDWSNPPFARWFEGGTTNLSYNCLDRHLEGPRADKTALIWEGEPGDVRRFSYRELHAEVCKAANALRSLGIGKNDLVALYMPMVPEAAIAMLACARIGAPHSVVFGGFSADALRDRLNAARARAALHRRRRAASAQARCAAQHGRDAGVLRVLALPFAGRRRDVERRTPRAEQDVRRVERRRGQGGLERRALRVGLVVGSLTAERTLPHAWVAHADAPCATSAPL